MQVLHAYEISREPIEMLFETIAAPDLEPDPEQFKFAQALVYTILNNQSDADVFIVQHSYNWEFDRIALIDKILLRMGIVEFLFFPDIPTKVSINECVDIAKRYSTEQSGKFVNGILDNILQDLGQRGRIQKTGRGLIDRRV